MNSGGEGGIRTPDTLLGCNCLAGSPVRPLQHLSAGLMAKISVLSSAALPLLGGVRYARCDCAKQTRRGKTRQHATLGGHSGIIQSITSRPAHPFAAAIQGKRSAHRPSRALISGFRFARGCRGTVLAQSGRARRVEFTPGTIRTA